MNRLHLHIGVADLDRSITFYSTLFGAEPSVVKDDYAKWLLDDPAVNLAISKRAGSVVGVEHVGVQTDSNDALAAITARLKAADEAMFEQEATTCCYAVSDKTWVDDPSGVRWETFFTHGGAVTYGADASLERAEAPAAPTLSGEACCSSPT